MRKVAIATPVRPGTTSGNDTTSLRWASHLEALGHQVEILEVNPDPAIGTDGQPTFDGSVLLGDDLLIVLHARRCASAARWWRLNRGDAPMVVGLAGTDLYADLPEDQDAMWTINAADALVVLQDAAIDHLTSFDTELGAKAHVIHQSVATQLPPRLKLGDSDDFLVVVISHLREVKDPLMCARAARLLPDNSGISIRHIGAAHSERWSEVATAESKSNPRYTWLGPLDHADALQLLARADVLACTSLLEGGANVVTEAIALGVPVIGTAIDGNIGLLGVGYPGLVPVKDDQALAALLFRLETEPAVLAELQALIDARIGITDPAKERASWADLLAGLSTATAANDEPKMMPSQQSP